MFGALDRLCRCGHLDDAHTHLREGTDCGLCSCSRYRPRKWRWF